MDNNTNIINFSVFKSRPQAKASRLPVSKSQRAVMLGFDDIRQLSEAQDLIRQVRQKCDKNTAMDAYLYTVILALTGAIASGAENLEGDSL